MQGATPVAMLVDTKQGKRITQSRTEEN